MPRTRIHSKKRTIEVLITPKNRHKAGETLYLLSIPGMRESIRKGMKESVGKGSVKPGW
jgi:antitoxin YefM